MLLMNPFIDSLMSTDFHTKRYNECSQLMLVLYVIADLFRELELSMDQLSLRGYHYKTERCLMKLEDKLRLINEGRLIVSWWFQYLVILKELNNISKLFHNSEVFR
ncbi:hypothetical protein RDI58_028908 [Solanum bulbocastanum]|uniref:Uncharacterized protein n=1 Tax=Solanum bulbocastanum TaxID=147425 RepID=A0AAN8SSS9_SOLBU